MSKNLSDLSGSKGLDENLFTKMGKLAIPTGAPSKEELDKLADEFLIGSANTFGAASFYDFLKPENKGKKVYVCNGTACLCAGTQGELTEKLKKHFVAEEIGHMTCLGRCHENSAFNLNGQNYSGLVDGNLDTVLKAPSSPKKDSYEVKAYGKKILTQSFTNLRPSGFTLQLSDTYACKSIEIQTGSELLVNANSLLFINNEMNPVVPSIDVFGKLTVEGKVQVRASSLDEVIIRTGGEIENIGKVEIE